MTTTASPGGNQNPDWPGDAAVTAAFGDLIADELKEVWKNKSAVSREADETAAETVKGDSMIQKVLREIDEDMGATSVQVEDAAQLPTLTYTITSLPSRPSVGGAQEVCPQDANSEE